MLKLYSTNDSKITDKTKPFGVVKKIPWKKEKTKQNKTKQNKTKQNKTHDFIMFWDGGVIGHML